MTLFCTLNRTSTAKIEVRILNTEYEKSSLGERAIRDHVRRWAQPKLGGTIRDSSKGARRRHGLIFVRCTLHHGTGQINNRATESDAQAHKKGIIRDLKPRCLLDAIAFTGLVPANPTPPTSITPASGAFLDPNGGFPH